MKSDIVSELSYMTEEELRRELRKSVALTTQGIAQLARVWAELESRGCDLSEFKNNLRRYLPLVAAGRLLPEAVVEFMFDPMRLRIFSSLPQATQRQLLSDGKVKLFDVETGGSRDVDLSVLTVAESRLVFDEQMGEVRSPSQQSRMLDRKRSRNDSTNTRLVVPLHLGRRIRAVALARNQTVQEFLADIMDRESPVAEAAE
jgi:hypothetical protein